MQQMHGPPPMQMQMQSPPPQFFPQGPPPPNFYNNQGPSRPRQQNPTSRTRGEQLRRNMNEKARGKQPIKPDIKSDEAVATGQKGITCINCGSVGHFSSDCKKAKVCYNCRKPEHVGVECPEWSNPIHEAKSLGSANQGLGFFHVDVNPRDDRVSHWRQFENCAVLTVEEGDMSQEDIVDKLKIIFDREWPWQLNPLDEYRYLTRFPPHKKIAELTFSDVTYFYLNKEEGILASLREWDGEIEPYGELVDTWIQLRGVPPKWSDVETFKQITATLGLIVDIDWSSFFNSFFSMVRIKLACRDPTKIPKERLMEMNKKLYLVKFKVEGETQQGDGNGSDPKDSKYFGGEDKGAEDSSYQEHMDTDHKTPDQKTSKDGKLDNKEASYSGNKGSKTIATWASLFKGGDLESMEPEMLKELGGENLLKQMEVLESDEEQEEEGDGSFRGADILGEEDDSEMQLLPEDLVEKLSQGMMLPEEDNSSNQDGVSGLPSVWDYKQVSTQSESRGAEVEMSPEKAKEKKKQKINQWGPVLVEKRSTRVQDGRTVMQRAQDLRKEWNLEAKKGMNKNFNPFSVLSVSEITTVADVVGINLGEQVDVVSEVVESFQKVDAGRKVDMIQSCSTVGCSEKNRNSIEVDTVLLGVDKVVALECSTPENSILRHQVEDPEILESMESWSVVKSRKKFFKINKNERNVLEH
ncbi:hypothetical protein EJB05_55411, partial [Eragrostis curvula]